MSLTSYKNQPLPTYADAYNAGYKAAYDAASNDESLDQPTPPGWASGNLHVPFQNGWLKALEELANA
jgi:hypothetical protein